MATSHRRRLTAGPGWNDHDLVCLQTAREQTALPTGAPLHDLRHASVVSLRLEGVPIVAVTEMLRHARASFTISNYEHAVHEMQEATAAALERRLGG